LRMVIACSAVNNTWGLGWDVTTTRNADVANKTEISTVIVVVDLLDIVVS